MRKIYDLSRKTLKNLKNEGLFMTAKKIKNYIKKTEIKNVEIKIPYKSFYEKNKDFSQYRTDIKPIAFYLPQFHTIPENDEWWGEGFTEWVNTKKAQPQYQGHYQPREPHEDIGYYDLSEVNTLKKQAKLAKEHGIFGFCFYHYWFSGKRLLEKPLDLLLKNPEIDLNFCICWANENWTRTWDGQEKKVLMEQKYTKEDPEKFILDLKKYIEDKRYIRVDGKPVIIVYNPGHILDIKNVFLKWREVAKEIGIGEILIWTCQTANNTAEKLYINDYIDAEVEFPPHNMWYSEIAKRDLNLNGESALIYEYDKLVDKLKQDRKNQEKPNKIYRACTLGWDNSPRRKKDWFNFYGFSLEAFYDWIQINKEEIRKNFNENERFLFINAWNEWAEGTYLEPDKKYGYSSINTFSRALYDIPFQDDLKIISTKTKNIEIKSRIAVQIHLFYTELLEEIVKEINNIGEYDLYITTNSKEKKEKILNFMKEKSIAKKIIVEVTNNRGRDVGPFLVQMSKYYKEYKYICHIHTKKTKTGDYGDYWRKYLYRNIFGNKDYIQELIKLFENDSKLGIIFPETYPLLRNFAVWGDNDLECKKILKDLKKEINLPEVPVFPVGNMFWARTSAIKDIFEKGYKLNDFPEESGQVNLTLAHAIERVWVYLCEANGYNYTKVFNNLIEIKKEKIRNKRIAFYVHYDKENIINLEDKKCIKYLFDFYDELIVITNSSLKNSDLVFLKENTTKYFERKNTGYDFGAWKQGLQNYGFENLKKFNQVSLLNNSFYGPLVDLNEVFEKMEKKNTDFWGITIFPALENGEYLKRKTIPKHIQSYFVTFNKKVIQSKDFYDFWINLKEYNDFKEVVSNCEIELTCSLEKKGFNYSSYIEESELMCKYLENYSLPYELPSTLLLLRSPFLKKKAFELSSEIEKQKCIYLKNNLYLNILNNRF